MLLDYILRDGNRDLAAFTEKLTDYLKKYFVIGGMPSAILKWLDTHNFFEVDDVQKQLVAAYENDFSKHTPKTNDRENKICVGQYTVTTRQGKQEICLWPCARGCQSKRI